MAEDVQLKPDSWLDEHGDALYRYALLQLRDEHLAEEMVQETLTAAWKGRERYAGKSSARTWLIGILKRKIIDHFRRGQREVLLEDVSPASDGDWDPADLFREDGHWATPPNDWTNPEQSLNNQQFWEVLHACIDALPPRLARIFMLRELQEENSENICKELSITPSNLWTMLYRARMGLRRCLDGNWVEGDSRC